MRRLEDISEKLNLDDDDNEKSFMDSTFIDLTSYVSHFIGSAVIDRLISKFLGRSDFDASKRLLKKQISSVKDVGWDQASEYQQKILRKWEKEAHKKIENGQLRSSKGVKNMFK